MAYKRYIKKNGKTYGPYTYRSKRVGGKVVSEYVGGDLGSVKSGLFLKLFIFSLVLAGLLLFSSFPFVGNVTLGDPYLDEVGYGNISNSVLGVINESEVNLTVNESADAFVNNTNDSLQIIEDGAPSEIILENESEVNFTINDTLEATNESGINLTINDTSEIFVNTTNFGVVINSPVRWKKSIFLNETKEVKIELPKEAENISVYEVIDNESGFGISSDRRKIKQDKTLIKAFRKISMNFLLTITGRAVDLLEESEKLEILLDEEVGEYEIEYETPGPVSFENERDFGKEIVISDINEIGYENILAYTFLENEVASGFIRLYHIVNDSRVTVDTVNYDLNENGLIDYIEWIVPHLSNQTYELEITVLNVQSYPVVGGTWEVLFNTSGVADLRIRAVNGTNWSDVNESLDLRFLEVKCGEEVLNYSWVNDSVFVGNYSCNETGSEVSLVLTSGVHDLEFDFGGVKSYAHNFAGTLYNITTDALLYKVGGEVTFAAEWTNGLSVKLLIANNSDFVDCNYSVQTGCLANSSLDSSSPTTATMNAGGVTKWYGRVCDSVNCSSRARTYNYTMDYDLANVGASFIGEDADDYSGRSVSSAGDVNGDGYDDLLIGAPGSSDGGSGLGQIYLIFGKPSGWTADIDLSNANASFWGENVSDVAGRSVSGAGDVNGDGYADLLIGVYGNDDNGNLAGQTYLILGKFSGWTMDTDLSQANASFIGESEGDWSGYLVSGAGDVNGDGYDDLLIGAYGNDDGGSSAGQTYLILGKASGWSMDIDLSQANASFIGEDAGDYSGYSLSSAGDVNGDGYADILIGASGDDDGGSDAGQTYLILGKASGWSMDIDLSQANASFIGEDADDWSGDSVSGAGDVNGDGYDDLLIGADGDDDGGSDAGQTYLILGKASGWSMDIDLSQANASFIGEDADDWSGLPVSSAGDVNGDGYDDLLIGVPENDDGGSDAGQTYLILGKASGWTMDIDLSQANASFIGEDVDDNSGASVSSAGDVNGDGYDDLLIGAYRNDDGGSDAGQTYLVLSSYNETGRNAGVFEVDLEMPEITIVSPVNTSYNVSAITFNISSNEELGYCKFSVDDWATNYTMDLSFDLLWGNYTLGGFSDGNYTARFWCNDSVGNVNESEIVNFSVATPMIVYNITTDALVYKVGGEVTFTAEWTNGLSVKLLIANNSDFIDCNYSVQTGCLANSSLDSSSPTTAVMNAGGVTKWYGRVCDAIGCSSRARSYNYTMDYDLGSVSASFIGEDASDESGYSVSGAGDVNGDGYDDLLIGAYGDDDGGNTAGQTYLILGKPSGWTMDIDLSQANASFIGENASDYSGWSVSSAGDVNGDGYADILIGAYGDDDGGITAGQTYLILGKASGWTMDIDLSQANASFWGESEYDRSGDSVSSAGDVNGDGYDDLLIGAYAENTGGQFAGQTYLILGKASGWNMDYDLSQSNASFIGEGVDDYSGRPVSSAGDVNGDGYDDILIGAYLDDDGGNNAGKTHLILGKSDGWSMYVNLSNSNASFWGEGSADYSGESVSGAGDVNGDGYDDLLIGAYYNGDGGFRAGQTYLILGRASDWTMDIDLSQANASFWGEDTYDYSGESVSGAGDVNGDGYADILIGAIGDDDGGDAAGQTYLILGKPSGWTMDYDLSQANASFWGEDADDSSGISVSSAGDVNGDGYDDLLIGAEGESDGGYSAGQTYLILSTHNETGRNTGVFGVDEDAPEIAIVSPVNTSYNVSVITFNISSNENLSYCKFSVDDWVTNYTMDLSFDLLLANYTLEGGLKGDYTARFWCNDSFGNVNDFEIVNFSVATPTIVYNITTDALRYRLGDNVTFTAEWTNGLGIKLLIANNSDFINCNYSVQTGCLANSSLDSSSPTTAVMNAGGVTKWYGRVCDSVNCSSRARTYNYTMDYDLANVSASFIGEDASDNSGSSVSDAGDVNGDGYDDLLIGAYMDEDGGTDAGQTYLILGKSSGWTVDIDLSQANASFWGEDAGDRSGSSVSSAGDVNGDGYDDILIGAYRDEDGGTDAGQTYLIFGKPSGWSMDIDLSNANASFIGEDADDWSGYSVSSAGDVNGDGYDDLLIGVYGNDDGGSSAGQTYLILGKSSGWTMDIDLSNANASFIGEDSGDYSGLSVSSAGDVNGDGYDDLLIGAYGNDDGGSSAGQTYLILGKALGWSMDIDLSNANASFIGEDANDESGYSVSSAGDVNGDGYDDLLIGVDRDNDGGSDAGQTYLILGRASGWSMDIDLSNANASFWGENASDYSGRSVSSAGDVNGDGYDDLLIGAYGDDDGGSYAGQTYLILGKASGWSMDIDLSQANASFIGEDSGDRSGISVSSTGDVNGDGYDDILIGAWGNDDGGSSAGQTYLILSTHNETGKNTGVFGVDLEMPEITIISPVNITYNLSIINFNISSNENLSYCKFSVDDWVTNYTMDLDFGLTWANYTLGGFSEGDYTARFWCNDSFDNVNDNEIVNFSVATPPLVYNITTDALRYKLGDNVTFTAEWENGLGVKLLIANNSDFIDCNYSVQTGCLVNSSLDSDSPTTAVMNASWTTKWYGRVCDSVSCSSRTRAYNYTMDYDLSGVSASFWGEDASDFSGGSVSSAGDVNGDGYDDILIGASDNDDGGSNAGQAYLILGKASGWSVDYDLSQVDASFWGEDLRDYSGGSVSSTGDVNGDGYDDLLIGANGDDDGGTNAGQTYLILGKASGWTMDIDLSQANASFWGEDASDFSGYSVSSAGDVNGDGYDDILIGAYGDDDGGSSAGQTYLILGKASGWTMDIDLSQANASFIGEDAYDYSGYSVSSAGDVNGDGYDDILIGAERNDDGGSYAGQTYLILGKASGWTMDIDLSQANASFIGEDGDDRSGESVSNAGDVNGDGYDDLLIGAYGDEDGGDSAGQTYLILGKASGWTMDIDLSNANASFIGEDEYDRSGYSVSSAGDVNGDGYDDFLIGAYGDEEGGGSDAGQTYLILGKSSGWTMDYDLSQANASFWGEDLRDYSGGSVSSTGDINGDGYDDLLIGAWGDDDGGSAAGQTYLVLSSHNETGRNAGVFEVDGDMPEITIISPVNTNYTSFIIDFNISSNEEFGYCKFSVDDWATNYTMDLDSGLTWANYTLGGFSEGDYTVRFWCNDSFGNVNDFEVVDFSINIPSNFTIYSPINGTNYTIDLFDINWSASDNFTWANFKIDDVQVFSPIYSKELNQVGFVADYDYMYNPLVVKVQGDYAYVGDDEDDYISVLNISNKSNPFIIGSFSNASSIDDPYELDVYGDYVYVCGDSSDSLVILNFSDKSSPVQVGFFQNLSVMTYPRVCIYRDDLVYIVANGDASLVIVNVTDKTAPFQEAAFINTTSMSWPSGFFIQGDYAYVAGDSKDSLTIINITDKNNPTQLSSFSDNVSLSSPKDVFVQGDYAYVFSTGEESVVILNVSDKENISLIGNFSNASIIDQYSRIFVENEFLYITSLYESAISIFDINDKENPFFVKSFFNSTSLSSVQGIYHYEDYVYALSSGESSLAIFEVLPVEPKNITLSNVGDGLHNLRIFAKDSFGALEQSDYVYFTINAPPFITIDSPLSELYYKSFLDFNLSANENLSFCKFSVDDWVTNYTMNVTFNLASYVNFDLSSGDYTARFWCNDSFGNVNDSKEVNFSLDSTPLNVSIYSPVNNSIYNVSYVDLNWSADGDAVWCEYSLDGVLSSDSNLCSFDGNFSYATSIYNNSRAFFVEGDYAYFSSIGDDNIRIVNISERFYPVTVGTFINESISSDFLDIYVQDDYLYSIYSPDKSFIVINITNKTNPVQVGYFKNITSFNGASYLKVSGDYAYVSSELTDSSFTIVDVTDKTNPVQVGYFKNTTSFNYTGKFFVEGDYVYVSSVYDNSFTIINVTDKTNPVQVGYLKNSTIFNWSVSVFVKDDLAYVTSILDSSLIVLNVADKTNPVQVGYFSNVTSLYGAKDVFVEDDFALVSSSGSFTIFDVSNYSNIFQVNDFQNNTIIGSSSDIMVDNNSIYSFSSSVFSIFNFITDPNNITITNLSEGNHFLSIFSRDIGGNFGESENIYFVADASYLNFTVYSPVNTTYSFSVGENYTIFLNVSNESFVADSWRYDLYDVYNDVLVNSSISFVPNITINAVRYFNVLTVYVNNTAGDFGSKNITFFVDVPNSFPILGDVDSVAYVCEGDSFSYLFNASDVDADDNLTGDILPKDPFYLSSHGEVDGFSFFEIISGVLTKADVGSHIENISITDYFGAVDKGAIDIEVIEINNLPVVEDIGAQTVWLNGSGSSFNYIFSVEDVEDGESADGNLFFNLTWGGGEDLFDINSSTGVMNYSPVLGHEGRVYSLKVCVRDNALGSIHDNISVCSPEGGAANVVCDNFTLTVTDENRAPEILNHSPEDSSFSATGTQNVEYFVEVYDEDGTIPDIDWYVDGVEREHNDNVSNDTFIYNFGCGTSGAHSVRAFTTDGSLNASFTWTVGVTHVGCSGNSGSGGGGSGGGGSGPRSCLEDWVCEGWNNCRNVKGSLDSDILSIEDYLVLRDECLENGVVDEEDCGFQTTSCYDLKNCSNTNPIIDKPAERRFCNFGESLCFDGVLNCHDGDCELSVDCGGPCEPCKTCFDGVKNQGESGVDCGGPCFKKCSQEALFNKVVSVVKNPMGNKALISASLAATGISIFILFRIIGIIGLMGGIGQFIRASRRWKLKKRRREFD